MNDDPIDSKLKLALDAIVVPYINRTAALEKSTQQKDTDIILLSNAVENLMKQIDDYRDILKKLPKGKLIS